MPPLKSRVEREDECMLMLVELCLTALTKSPCLHELLRMYTPATQLVPPLVVGVSGFPQTLVTRAVKSFLGLDCLVQNFSGVVS